MRLMASRNRGWGGLWNEPMVCSVCVGHHQQMRAQSMRRASAMLNGLQLLRVGNGAATHILKPTATLKCRKCSMTKGNAATCITRKGGGHIINSDNCEPPRCAYRSRMDHTQESLWEYTKLLFVFYRVLPQSTCNLRGC